jgi:transcription-repair coupling factor (superfamily II helicase)
MRNKNLCKRKRQIKTIAANVDTLTPQRLFLEPYSFHWWLRDLSVITTTPPNRYPIETNVVGFSEDQAMRFRMIQRNGQVFFH